MLLLLVAHSATPRLSHKKAHKTQKTEKSERSQSSFVLCVPFCGLDIESEVDHITFMHDVVFSFQS